MEALSARINRGVEYSLFVLGFSMALIVALQVVFRYGLNRSLFWSEELARYILVWLTFLGASVAYYRRVHPGVDVLTSRMGPGLQKAAAVAVHLVSMLLFGVMVVYGIAFAGFVRLQISPALNLPKWVILSILPVSGAILMLHALTFLRRDLARGGRDR